MEVRGKKREGKTLFIIPHACSSCLLIGYWQRCVYSSETIQCVMASSLQVFTSYGLGPLPSFSSLSSLPSLPISRVPARRVNGCSSVCGARSPQAQFPLSDVPVVYCDGCCFNNGRSGASAGVGVYWGEGSPK